MKQLRASLPPLTDPATRFARVEAERDRDLQRQVSEWERKRPMRERAAAAMQRAQERLLAELGEQRPGRVPVIAAVWSDKPTKSRIW